MLRLGLVFLSFILVACSSTEEDTGVTFKLGLTDGTVSSKMARAAGDAQTFTDVGGTSFTITTARVNIRHIEFDHADENADSTDNKVKITGPFVYDLINQTSSPAISVIDLPTGTYKRIDIRLDDAEVSDGVVTATDQLAENTMYIAGTYGADANSFEFLLEFNEDIRFEDATGISVDVTTATDMLLTLDVTDWLDGINITQCIEDDEVVVDSDGALLVDDNNSGGNCSDMEGTIKTNIKNSYDLK